MAAARFGCSPDAEPHQGLAATRLESNEDREEGGGRDEGADGLGRGPADDGAPDDAEDSERQGGRDGDGPATVEPAWAPEAGREDAAAGHEHDDRDGHIDEEHPAPVEAGGQDAAKEDPGGPAGRRCGAIEREGLGQFPGVVREEGHQHGERGRSDERRTDALEGAACEEYRFGGRQAGDQRGAAKDGEAGHEDATGAIQVGKSATEQEEAAERDDVGVEDP